MEKQLPNESQRFWGAVTKAIKNKQFNEATKLKTDLEERQREKAARRKEHDEEWKPRFFIDPVTPNGRPDLSEEGKLALRGLQAEDYALVESESTAA